MTATIHQFFDWPYLGRIIVQNPQTDPTYQSVIDLPWRGGMKADFSDLRFFNLKGENLPYYLESKTDGSTAKIWIRGATDREVLYLFGNPDAESESDGDGVFDLHETFPSGALNTSKWTEDAVGAITDTRDGYNRITGATQSGGTYWIYDGSDSANQHQAKYSPASSFIIEWENKINLTATNQMAEAGIAIVASDNTVIAYVGQGDWDGLAINTYREVVSEAAPTRANGYAQNATLPYTSKKSVSNPDTTNFRLEVNGTSIKVYDEGVLSVSFTRSSSISKVSIIAGSYGGYPFANYIQISNLRIRGYAATEPTLTAAGIEPNPFYLEMIGAWLGILTDDVIRFAGTGTVQVLGEERESIAGAGAISIETVIRGPISIAGAAGLQTSLHLVPAPATPTGAGGVISEPARLHTPLDIEAGEGSAYVAPTPVQFDVWQYRFETLDISRSAQDALWRCDGQINGLQAPLAYKSFAAKVPDHNGVLRTIFFGFVPGRDYVQAVAADKSTVQGFDAGFYLTRQYLPDGDLFYPAKFLWTPTNLIKYWLGEEVPRAGCPSYWERVTGIMPYRIHDPISWGHDYVAKDWNFQPKTTKAQAIQEVCEYSGMVFLVKWRSVNGAMTPCAYLVHQDDIDHATHGLDLPPMVTFTSPDPCIANGSRATLQSDEKYNRIEVRSASPSGAWFHAVRETPALQAGEELPIEYLEERSDLPIDADHGAWCTARADELYAYYTAYSYTYTLTLIDRTDLELYQRCQFSGFDAVPDGEVMRIVSIQYRVLPTHTEVGITVTPDSRLSDLRRLQRSQTADSVSEVQTIARGQIDQIAAGEVGTVVGIDGAEAIVELERKADSSVRGRIV